MPWQGVPFLLEPNGVVEDLILSVGKIPKIIIDSGFAWETLISATIAGMIPGLIAYLSIRQSNKTAEENRVSQNELFEKDRDAQMVIAKDNIKVQVLSANRQSWINTLRDCASDYLSQVIIVKNVKVFFRTAKKVDVDLLGIINKHYNVAEMYIIETGKLNALDSKLRLLMNPKEEEAIEIFKLMDTISKNTGNVGSKSVRPNISELDKCIKQITMHLQDYLKKEWERVKKME